MGVSRFRMSRSFASFFAAAFAGVVASACSPPPPQAFVPAEASLHADTLVRVGERGDNWCITWTADDSQMTSMCDGSWLEPEAAYHNRLYRILGGPQGFDREDLTGYPSYRGGEGSWFGYGIVSLGGTLYSAVSKTPGPRWSGPFRGIKLLKSTDNGVSWSRVSRHGEERPLAPEEPGRYDLSPAEMFFFEESGRPHREQIAYPFSFVSFVQNGRDGSASPDGYAYIYSPEGAASHELLLARVRAERLDERAAWEYFVRHGEDGPVWTRDLEARGPAHVFPERCSDGHYFGWYSWLPSVVWNEAAGLYIMVNGGTYGGDGMTDSDADYFDPWMHTESGSLGFWWSAAPYGPWREIQYVEHWTVDDPNNRTYQPKLSPKWISGDGREMVLIWSDAMKNAEGRSHRVNYMWNQMRITLSFE